MFVNYQTARNAFVAAAAALAAGTAVFFSTGSDDSQAKPEQQKASRVADARVPNEKPPATNSNKPSPQNFVPQVPAPTNTAPTNTAPTKPVATNSAAANRVAAKTDAQRYSDAMSLALGQADKSGFAKDVLGPSSPWKLNLYDDDLDGQYDRGKLDKDRDDREDEQWTFKKGRWEKDNGRTLWLSGKWVGDPGQVMPEIGKSAQMAVSPELKRYRAAMQIATGRADRSGKGKDVLGPRSPWKLNLYDDDKDGQWDRAKLDKNRDEIDDEKWNFKKGRWEKDGGSTIWNDDRWQSH